MASELSLFACIHTFLTVQVGILGSLKSYLLFMCLWMVCKIGITLVYNLVYSGVYLGCMGLSAFSPQACFMNWSGLGLFL